KKRDKIYNNNGEDASRNAFSTGREVCNDKTLKHLITREDTLF
ncbi:5030_t:CDS:1, partial [Paraglomus occultum]